jgi:hypothetical protein
MESKSVHKKEVLQREVPPTRSRTFVYTIRDWKEYMGESLLIIFSVLLALILTEYFNHLHDKENTKTMLQNIVSELEHNKKVILELKAYNAQVLTNIDSVLASTELQHRFVSNDEFHLDVIAPQGVLYRYLDDAAWTVAKNNNVISKVDVETVAALTKLYEDEAKMMKVEEEVAKVIFDRASRDPKQVHLTLVIIRDLYHGWAVDRTDGLLKQIDNAVKKVQSY